MEYAVGGSIANLLKKYGQFNEILIRVYTKQILEGLEYLHYHKIIHRDIKGANVLVGNDGVCKLADFGAAKRIIGEDQGQYKSLRGTVNYMAPEVMRQDGHGRFADIWSLGCLVVEMATGCPPFSNITNPYAVFLHICNSDKLPELPSELSDSAKDFISKCFKRNPNSRSNVCELLEHAFIAAEPLYKTLGITQVEEQKNEDVEKAFHSTFVLALDSDETIRDSDPNHNVKAPFGTLRPIQRVERGQLEEEKEEYFIQRSVSSESAGPINYRPSHIAISVTNCLSD